MIVEETDAIIVKNRFIDCIPIKGNTIFTTITILPELPQDLYIDQYHQCIGGIYNGYLYGKQDYRLVAYNTYGSTEAMISLYYTRAFLALPSFIATVLEGLISEYYMVNEDYIDVFPFLPTIPPEAVHLAKKSVVYSLNYTTFDISSPFYSFDLSPVSFLYSVFRGHIAFTSSGVYHFQTQFESEKDRVSSIQ